MKTVKFLFNMVLFGFGQIIAQQMSSPKLELSRSISGNISESSLSESEYNFLSNEDNEKKTCCGIIKKTGTLFKNLFKKQIFNLLAIENLVVSGMVIYDYINTDGDRSKPQITPQWVLGFDSACNIACILSAAYAQWCKNKLDRLNGTLEQEQVKIKTCCSKLWSKFKQSIGYIYGSAEAAFAIASVVDTLSNDFNIPLNIYFAESVQGLVLTTASVCAAHYYQNKLEHQNRTGDEPLV